MKEITIQTFPVYTGSAYFVIRNSSLNVWNGASFASWSDSSISSYAQPLTLEGVASGFYYGDFPTAILTGNYSIVAYKQSGGSPAISDSPIGEGAYSWNGTSLSTAPAANPAPGTVTAYLYTRSNLGTPVSGKILNYRLLNAPSTGDGSFDGDTLSSTSDSNGLISVVMLVGSSYQYWVGSGPSTTITITDTTPNPFELSEVVSL